MATNYQIRTRICKECEHAATCLGRNRCMAITPNIDLTVSVYKDANDSLCPLGLWAQRRVEISALVEAKAAQAIIDAEAAKTQIALDSDNLAKALNVPNDDKFRTALVSNGFITATMAVEVAKAPAAVVEEP